MNDYLKIDFYDNNMDLTFFITNEKVFKIGEKINEINEDAYMNGYNWEALFNYYLEKYDPAIFEQIETDCEAGIYVAYFELTENNKKIVNKFASIIENFIENEEKLYNFIIEEGINIDWD